MHNTEQTIKITVALESLLHGMLKFLFIIQIV